MTIFSFPATWSLLAEHPELPTLDRSPSVRALMKAPVETLPEPLDFPGSSGPDQWEMVIPKMARPPKKLAEPAAAEKPHPAPLAPAELPIPVSWQAPFSASIIGSRPGVEAAPFSAPVQGFSFLEKLSLSLAIAGLSVLLLVGAVLMLTPAPRRPSEPVIVAGDPLPVGLAGWITATDARRRVSILRGSRSLADFRLEFQSRIDGKALGWVFRAKDPQNFYANKLEIIKPGLNPVVALKRFAVINGQDQPVNQILLTTPVRLDTNYKVRVDVLGNQFTTWIMDQKLDHWTDDRLQTGGVGWYSEIGERRDSEIALSVFPLTRK